MSDGGPQTMTPSRPYLLRALHEWICDNGLTPQILVDNTHPELTVPDAVRNSDKLVLNLSPSAVRDLEIDNDYVSFVARFSGVSHGVVVPIAAVQAVYARENGQGMMFPETEDFEEQERGADSEPSGGDDDRKPARGRPNLKVIK
ncbi:MAG: ClpXP protease specificity-enhancing factor [Wenzhouxiangellaceae bacterium]|nr:ClpXP protease specificity-enhancing factor [Wenzhouxiangellaceae bacterium]